MSTTHHVKMAKASQKDIDGAIELYQFLEAMRDGRPAADAVEEFDYEGYGDLVNRKADDAEFLLRAHERGGLFRVAWGLQTLLDPCNEVVDPNLPHLELHPKHEQAAKERDAARAEVQQCRVEIKALCDENEAIMRAVGEAHEALRRGMKLPCIAEAKPQPGEGHVGVSGERDPDHPCEEFRPGTPGTAGNCYGDGHFLCNECGHLNKPQGEGGA